MSENAHGSSAQKCFNGDGNSGAAEYKAWKRWARAALVVKKVGGMPPEALGPWIYTLLDGQAALALESIEITDMCTDGGEELFFRELDQRFPDKVAADRMGEAMEEAFGLKIMKNETMEAFTGRSRLVFARLQADGVNLPSEVRGYIVLRGCRLGSLGRATVMSATRRSWEFDEVCTASRASFLGCPPDRWSHGTFGVDELEDRTEDELQDHAEFGGDTEFESEIEALVGAFEPIEESDAIAVLATWQRGSYPVLQTPPDNSDHLTNCLDSSFSCSIRCRPLNYFRRWLYLQNVVSLPLAHPSGRVLRHTSKSPRCTPVRSDSSCVALWS